jgi:hypothetical protein
VKESLGGGMSWQFTESEGSELVLRKVWEVKELYSNSFNGEESSYNVLMAFNVYHLCCNVCKDGIF